MSTMQRFFITAGCCALIVLAVTKETFFIVNAFSALPTTTTKRYRSKILFDPQPTIFLKNLNKRKGFLKNVLYANDEINGEVPREANVENATETATTGTISARVTNNKSINKNNDDENKEEQKSGSNSLFLNEESEEKKQQKLELTWCDRSECFVGNTIRETVTNENEITFQGPATGQVTYNWIRNHKKSEKDDKYVLLLVKKNDPDLIATAAEAVRELISTGEIHVLLDAELCAKLKHYYGVDSDCIHLFESSRKTLGFGSNTENIMAGLEKEEQFIFDSAKDNPDLICTLGGDGLLMWANSLFPGPIPPVLCIAGGSLGFLTPFSKKEMVRATRISLGCFTEDDDDHEEEESSSLSITNGNDLLNDDIVKGEEKEQQLLNGDEETIYPNPYSPFLSKKFSMGAYTGICISMRMRLDCRIINREGVIRARYNVLNEVVIDRGSSSFLSNLECFVDDVHLTTVQADGIIFST